MGSCTIRCWAALLSALLVVVATLPGVAQLQYATTVVSFANTMAPDQAADGSPATAAQLAPSTLSGPASLRLGFGHNVPPGTHAGLRIRPGQLLDATILNALAINTYQKTDTKNTLVQHITFTSLLNANVLPADTVTLRFSVDNAFNEVELVAQDVLNARYVIELFEAFGNQVPVPLPVELVRFEGKPTPAGVALRWTTATELRNHYFEVQRAVTPLDFRTIGRVSGAGGSEQAHHYQFMDHAPDGAALRYYRLRQVDTDGHQTFSAVVAVAPTPTPPALVAYPSPTAIRLTVAGAPTGAQLVILDQLGQPRQQLTMQSGAAQSVEVGSLPGGVYFLRNLLTGQYVRFEKLP